MNAVSENLGKAVDKVNSGLKSLGAKVGNINVPIKVNVVTIRTDTGYSVPEIHVETKPIKELVQKFSGKGTTKGTVNSEYTYNMVENPDPLA